MRPNTRERRAVTTGGAARALASQARATVVLVLLLPSAARAQPGGVEASSSRVEPSAIQRNPVAESSAATGSTLCGETSDGAVDKREVYRRGAELADAGSYVEALRCFKRAYTMSPHPDLLVVIADLYRRLQRPVEHYRVLTQLLERHAAQMTPLQLRQVDAERQALRAQVGRVDVSTTPEGAQVFVDGELAGITPLQDFALAPGRHALSVHLEQYRDETRAVHLEAGTIQTVGVALERSLGQLRVGCSVGGVRVEVDGVEVGVTPVMHMFHVSTGTRTVSFQREGERASFSVVVSEHAARDVECPFRPPMPNWLPAAAVGVGSGLLIGAIVYWRFNDGDARALSREVRDSINAGTYRRAEFEARNDALYDRGTWAWTMGVAGGLLAATGGAAFIWHERTTDLWAGVGDGPTLVQVSGRF